MYTTEQRKEYITLIRHLPDELESLVDGLSNEQLTTCYLEGEWTVAQNVHHLVDMHMNSYLRLKRILTEDRPDMQILEQNGFAECSDAVEADISYSLAMLRGLHHRWVMVWESLTDEQWERVGLIRGSKEITPDYLLEGYARHGKNHLDQIRRTLAEQP